MYPTSSVHLWCRDQDSKKDGDKDRGIQFHIMEDREQLSEAMERLEKSIDKEVAKLKYYMEPAVELIENNDYLEMEIALKQGTQIDKITDLISQLEGTKLDFGVSARDVRQWKKDKKNEFSPFIQERDKIYEILPTKKREKNDEIERQNWEAKRERKERVTRERQNKRKNSGRRSPKLSYAWRRKGWRWKRPQELLTQSFPS